MKIEQARRDHTAFKVDYGNAGSTSNIATNCNDTALFNNNGFSAADSLAIHNSGIS